MQTPEASDRSSTPCWLACFTDIATCNTMASNVIPITATWCKYPIPTTKNHRTKLPLCGHPIPKVKSFPDSLKHGENSFTLQHELIDSNLNSKKHTHEIGEKISRGIGILSKLTHFVTIDILNQLYYSLVYPFLTYIWFDCLGKHSCHNS